MIQETRVRALNDRPLNLRGEYVLYWMQSSQRAHANHALESAADRANELNLPLVVWFGISENYPGANARHYAFMLEGLRETRMDLAARGIRMVIQKADPPLGAAAFAKRAALAVCDAGYLRHQRLWRARFAGAIDMPCFRVESDVLVPVGTASDKAEIAARTLRPRIERHARLHLVPVQNRSLQRSSLEFDPDCEEISVEDPAAALATLAIDRSVPPVAGFPGGHTAARKRLDLFVREHLAGYHEQRNDPAEDRQSNLSPYLHFGQISPLEIMMRIDGLEGPGVDAFVEELIVRRELGCNFVRYTRGYDTYNAVPAWAQATLAAHAADPRPYLYSRDELEAAVTHDPAWNVAQRQMMCSGKMHGYMRMYWVKKILEWSASPQEAFTTALYLNDKYELDGRDPNGYAGISWCFGTHDRPWGERPIYGTVRCMMESGLRRKFDLDNYVRQWPA